MKLLAAAALALALAAPAAAADREVFFGDAFQLEAADPGPFDRLPDGRLACLSDACANRTVTVGGVTVRVLPRVTAKEVAARQPSYRADTTVPRRPSADGLADELLFAGAGACSLSAPRLWPPRRSGDGTVRLRSIACCARCGSCASPPSVPRRDRRRALDHLAATLGDAPPAAQATRLAWSRPEPEPEPTLAVAEEVVR